ncbi:hypothetical protein BB560_001564 [Smittium megazygosporum]|uniref:Uncharacterized protein n=1 Tax=Smittium megazygosporum TaxID=133381 RepID=A0A2T9ZH84_9FUNG|nr:hypothetical protein BB560_001564 [Smittium megazygosporum]
MIIKNSILFLALGLPAVFGATCQNEGATRCTMPNGKGAKYIVCENGKEVEKTCEGAETCHGNGNTGIMCIDAVAFKKRQSNSGSTFGGYEPLINSFNNGMYGDANSFNKFVTNMRSMMLTDKNALGDVSSTVGDGVQASKGKIASNTQNIGSKFSTTQGINGVITSAKNFQRSLNQNSAGYSSLMADVATNTKTNPNNLGGVSSLVTNTYTASASGLSPNTAMPSADVNRALNNMNVAFNMFYPNSLGKLFQGSMAPSSIASNVVASSGGDQNATASVFRSLIGKTADGQQFIAPFTSAGVKITDSVTNYATPARVSNVLKKYRSVSPSSSNTVNVMNGVANVAVSSRGSYRASIDNSNIAFTSSSSGSNCGCSNSDSFAAYLAILGTLSMSQMVVPSGGCCYSNGASVFARSLIP